MMKQSIKVWVIEKISQGHLWAYVNSLIAEGYTIISVTPIEFDTPSYSKTKLRTTEAVILVGKED